MPTIKVNERLKLDTGHSVKRINLNGIVMTGGPLTLHGNFDKIALISCTINPGYDDDNKRSLGIRIEQQEKQEEGEQNQEYNAATTTTAITTTTVTNTNNRYATQKSNKASLKEISLIKSISGGTIVDDSVSLISLEDSIIHNLGGPAIFVKQNNKKEKNPILKLEATRSNILSKYADNYILELKDICCSNCILTNRVSVKLNEKQKEEDLTENDADTSCTSLRYSRFEQGSTFEDLGKGNNAIVDCTIERPIFISTTFGHPAYLHLDHLSSKSILEGAQNTLEMGAFNKSYKPLRMRNLELRLQEFLPLGIKAGVVYTY